VPTITESGLADFGASNWWVLAAPKGTPGAIVDKLHAAVGEAMKAKSVQDQFARAGFLANPQTPQELVTAFRGEAEAWSGVIKKAGIALPK
jgi:tripartite-type tricarboxylate transporter receptor subunit TctC